MTSSTQGKQRNSLFYLIVIAIGVIGLIQPGCDCSSDSSTAPPPPISSVFPDQNSETALVSTIVAAVFRNDMDGSTINTSTFTLTLGGAPVAVASVTYDSPTKTAILTPADDLISGSEYRATISTAVQDINGGNPITIDRVWSFTVSPTPILISKNINGAVGNSGACLSPNYLCTRNVDISSDGRFIVFESNATNLTTDSVSNGIRHIYRKD